MPGAYPRVEHLKSASLGQAPASPANIRLGWKSLSGTNSLAYYENSLITAVKSFVILDTERLLTAKRGNYKNEFMNR